MSNFTFVTTNTNQNSGGERKQVDWEALNKHVIEVAKTQTKARSLPGVIAGIVDLGEHDLEDAEQVFTGDAAAEAAAIAEKPATYFKDGFDEKGNAVRLKCWPQKPVQQMAALIDFPQIIVDKGQFFGNSNPQPLRVLLNREFTLPGEKLKIVASPYNIRETKHPLGGNKSTWAFAKNNGLHKLADAVGILDANGLFTKDRIGELVGKVAQFQVQVFMKPGKNGGEFYQENVKLVGMVPEGVPIPEAPEGTLHLVNLFAPNDPEAIKQLRVAVKNHIKKANNYDGSVLKGELEALEGNRGNSDSEEPKEEDKPKAQGIAPSTPAPESDDFDDDVPF